MRENMFYFQLDSIAVCTSTNIFMQLSTDGYIGIYLYYMHIYSLFSWKAHLDRIYFPGPHLRCCKAPKQWVNKPTTLLVDCDYGGVIVHSVAVNPTSPATLIPVAAIYHYAIVCIWLLFSKWIRLVDTLIAGSRSTAGICQLEILFVDQSCPTLP